MRLSLSLVFLLSRKQRISTAQPVPMRPLDFEIILGADIWDDEPSILSAAPGFDGIIGLPLTVINRTSAEIREDVLAGDGAWSDLPEVCEDGSAPPLSAMTSATDAIATLFLFDCDKLPVDLDGFPMCFSWPIIPSTIKRENILYTRSDGAQFNPTCIANTPNVELNERHCIVIFDDFFNRKLPGEPGHLWMEKIEIVGDILMVGPNNNITSANGMFVEGDENRTSYLNGGPYFLGARLSPLDDVGEGAGPMLQALYPENSGIDLFGDSSGNLFRLRLYYNAGMKPDGVTSLLPTEFGKYFTVVFSTGEEIDDSNEPTTVRGATVTVLGLADLGVRQDTYDFCYVEDNDNYIDIILQVEGTDAPGIVMSLVDSVKAFHKGAGLVNPGGPGRTPTPGVRNTVAGTEHTVPVRVDLNNEYRVSYCKTVDGQVSFEIMQCVQWLATGMVQNVSYGTPAGSVTIPGFPAPPLGDVPTPMEPPVDEIPGTMEPSPEVDTSTMMPVASKTTSSSATVIVQLCFFSALAAVVSFT